MKQKPILIQGDCMTVLKSIDSNSIDAVIADPPYGRTGCPWDTVLPLDKLWFELKRIRKDRGATVLFGSEPFSSQLRLSNTQEYKYDWIWNKNVTGNPFNAKYQPLKIHEVISVFGNFPIAPTGSGLKTYYPQMGTGRPYTLKESNRPKIWGRRHKMPAINNSGTRYPISILQFSRDNDGYHPCQKPVDLLEYLIKTYTRENEVVLDFTMGSGTTGVAAINTHRQFIGIEKEQAYFDVSVERIEEHWRPHEADSPDSR